ncbi:hypothetical protein ACFW04_006498 [Cataglyphis niger]
MCSCIDGNSTLPNNRAVGRSASYERLGSNLTIFELSSSPMRRSRRGNQDLIDSERQEELRFYNNDHSFTTVIVEKDLRTIDLCELLKVKRNVIGTAWSIIEIWPKLGIERTLEDNEDILAVHRELEMFASRYERRFYFSEDFLKYEPFVDPKQFFPADMVAFPSGEDRSTFIDAESALRDSEHLITLAHLSDYNIYRIPNAKRVFGAPFEWGVCLRPNSNAEAEDTEAGEPGIKVIAFENEKSRACWLTAMRLAKYGKQLRENYRAFKNKQCEQNGSGSPKEQYSSYNVSNIFDERRNCWLYTLDKGATKFYDLLQLVEFYQLNAGSLPTRLTHYVQNGVKPPLHKPEDGGASPSPPEGSSQRVNSTDKVAEPCGKPSSI